MRYQMIGDCRVSRVAHGCMRLGELDTVGADRLIRTALERGINFFDHADIYGGGECERLFGRVLKRSPGLREQLLIQTKCGIRHGLYDFSKQHILRVAEESLERLGVEYVDFLLLHRPDTLYDADELAEAFALLKRQGKVRHFGVSNCNPLQIQLLEQAAGERMLVNQLQFSLGHTLMVDTEFNVNTRQAAALDSNGHVLSYCRLNGITVQPWSPLQNSASGKPLVGDPALSEFNEELERIAADYGITPTGLAVAWILRHPAAMQPIVGTVNAERLTEICDAADTVISREEWYRLYKATGKVTP